VSAGFLYVGLSVPPLLFGSRQPIFVASWCLFFGAALVFAPTRRLIKGHLLVLAALAFVALCFAFVLHEQLSSHPWVAAFNPAWAKASEVLGQQLVPSVSLVRGEPFFAIGPSLANTLALVLGLLVGTDRDRAMRAVRVLAWAGVCYAVYGILSLALDPTHILGREKMAYVGDVTSTFVNRNTAAAYFGSCSCIWLLLLCDDIRRSFPRGEIKWRIVMNRLLAKARTGPVVRFVMFWVCLMAMLMTSSRGGVLVSLAIMILVFMLYFRRDLPRGRALLLVLIAGCGGTALLLQVLAGNVTDRIELYGVGDGGRLAAYRSTLHIISDHPWFGTGLGTFAAAFPPYRSSDISLAGVWDIAHDTPLEFASEMGIPLTLVVAVAWIAALVLLGAGLRGRRQHIIVPLSCFAVSLIANLHSLIDFSLQITGYSIVVFALLGIGLSQAIRTLASETPIRRPRSRSDSTEEKMPLSSVGI
jgi:O-antigen ligase